MNHTQTPKTAMVTGATGAIGSAIARLLALKNYRVVIIARNAPKALKVMQEIITATGNPQVSYELADLSRHVEIQSLAGRGKDHWMS